MKIIIPDTSLSLFEKFKNYKDIFLEIGKTIPNSTGTIISHNWFIAGKQKGIDIVSEIIDDDDIYICSDWVVNYIRKKYGLGEKDFFEYFKYKIICFECSAIFNLRNEYRECFYTEKSYYRINFLNPGEIKKFAYNLPFLRFQDYDFQTKYQIGLDIINENNYFITPLGCPQHVLDYKFSKTKTILLDYYFLLNRLEKNSKDTYSKSIQICQILQSRGWSIKTLNTPNTIENFTNLKTDDQFTYSEVLKIYKNHTFYFTNVLESHGWAICENMQMGNIILIFEENIHNIHFENFKNCVKMTLNMSNTFCADMIEHFYDLFNETLHEKNVEFAKKALSADTFIERISKYF